VLAEGAVAAIAVRPAAPELVTIASRPVRVGLGVAIVGVGIRRFGYPFRREDALAVPDAFLQIHLAQLSDVLRRSVQAGTAEADAARVGFPDGVFDAQRVK